jgi:hypothetical protein
MIEWARIRHTTNTAACSLPSVPVTVERVELHRNTRYVIMVEVIQTLMRFDDRNSASRELTAGDPRTVRSQSSEDTTIVAVEKLRRCRIWGFHIRYYGMWCRVDPVKWTDVSEERIASIFRVQKSASEELAWAGSSRLLSLRLQPQQTIILMLFTNLCIKSGLESSRFLHGKLTGDPYCEFLETVPPGKTCCEAEVVVSARRNSNAVRGRYPAVVERDIQECGLDVEDRLHGDLSRQI